MTLSEYALKFIGGPTFGAVMDPENARAASTAPALFSNASGLSASSHRAT